MTPLTLAGQPPAEDIRNALTILRLVSKPLDPSDVAAIGRLLESAVRKLEVVS